MATFAEYSSQTMGSNDFTLYPYQDVWNQDQPYLPTTLYPDHNDQTYLSASTFDSYESHPAYTQPDQYNFAIAQAYQSKNDLDPLSPNNYSPANSASHSFDLRNLPVLSSTSDSGASVQSTISSAMGSPSAQPQQPSEWNHSFPEIVQGDMHGHGLFATTGFEHETLPVTDKGCVGELTTISSFSQLPQILPSVDLTPSYSSSLDLLTSHVPRACSPDEAWRLQAPTSHATSPYSCVLQPAAIVPVTAGFGRESSSPRDSVFRSPSTPASATSPVLERVKGKRKTARTPTLAKRSREGSPLAQAVSYDENELPARPQAPPPTLRSPFFSQSSGQFVPPLDFSYPSLIQPTGFSPPTQFTGTQAVSPHNMGFTQIPSSGPPRSSVQNVQHTTGKVARSQSPYMHTQTFQPYPQHTASRRQSMSSNHSRNSQQDGSVTSEDSTKGLCPIPTCGRHVKDLKAHMLTHQNERPEKCPIPTCEYHIKGFARKYDKNRHTLTHYKGTMVCGFCPGSGSAAEKSFNRADVFKRHLTSVHGVEQTPPNARRKSPSTVSGKRAFDRDVSGMCSTCGVTFASAQDFYEHLDECVLRVVQRADPSEAINEKLLSSIADDQEVQETMEKHMLPTSLDYSAQIFYTDDEEADDDEEGDDGDTTDGVYGGRSGKSGKGAIKSRKNATGNPS